MNPHFRLLLLAYIDAVNKYAILCKSVEDLPVMHLETLMLAEGLTVMGTKVLKYLENEDENG